MTSIGELVGSLALDDKFSGPANEVGKSLGFMGDSFKAITGFAGLAAGAITAAAGGIAALGVHGSTVNDVRDGFAAMAARASETSEVMLGALRSGTQGTISDFQLMESASSAMSQGLLKNASDAEALAAGAKLLAGRAGGDTREAFEKLTAAMAGGQTGALKQLGLFVDSAKAADDFASKLGVTRDQLSEQGKQQAIAAATLDALRQQLDTAGGGARSFADIIDAGKARLSNFVDGLGSAVAASPVVMKGMEGIGDALESAFGANQQALIDTIMEGVNKFAILLVDAAGVGVEGLRFLVNAWEGAKFGFNAFMEVMAIAVSAGAGMLADLASKAEGLPIVGEKLGGMAGGLRDIAALADGAALSFGQQAEAALDSAATSNGAFDTLRAKLGEVSSGMSDALRAQGELGAGAEVAASHLAEMGLGAEGAALTVAKMGEASTITADFMAEMADRVRIGQQELQDELTLSNATGLERRLAEIEIAREKELGGLQELAFAYPAEYEKMAADVELKYQRMAEAATGANRTIAERAAEAGFATITAHEQATTRALELFNDMKKSGEFTAAQLKKAWAEYETSRQEGDRRTVDIMGDNQEIVLQGASQIFGVLGQKYKAAAIAGAVLSTYAAVAKSLASAPWPASLALAAGALAAGMANVAKIRGSGPGFAEGTPGTSFVDFGRETVAALHGEEAIVNRAQGETLGEVLRRKVERANDRTADEVRALHATMAASLDRLERIQREQPLMMRDAVLLAGA